MKKLLFIAITALLCACVGPEGPRGPQGPQGPQGKPGDGGANWDVTWFTVNSEDWELVEIGTESFYMYTVTGDAVAQLDEFAAREGLFQLYIYPYGVEKDADGNYVGYQALLPYTRYYTEFSYATDYEFVPGELSIFITYSDYRKMQPDTFTFRLVTLW
jgi:hypothetical protein